MLFILTEKQSVWRMDTSEVSVQRIAFTSPYWRDIHFVPYVFNEVFQGMPVLGWLISIMFYLLLTLAAVTSLMSLHEVSTAFFYEELHISRKRGATIVTVSTTLIGCFCSLSLGVLPGLSVGGKPLFDVFDFVTGQIFLPVGGFLTCIFLGWFVPKQLVRVEFTNWGTVSRHLFLPYLFLVRFVAPIAILCIFMHQLGLF